MSDSNRRKHPRVRAQGIAVRLQTAEGLAFCVVENIAEGGLYLRTQHLLPLGSRVSLKLAQPGMRKSVSLEASVVNVVEKNAAKKMGVQAGMGLSFDKVHRDDAVRLNELIRALAALPNAWVPERPTSRRRTTSAEALQIVIIESESLDSPAKRLKDLENERNELQKENNRLRKQLDELLTALGRPASLTKRTKSTGLVLDPAKTEAD